MDDDELYAEHTVAGVRYRVDAKLYNALIRDIYVLDRSGTPYHDILLVDEWVLRNGTPLPDDPTLEVIMSDYHDDDPDDVFDELITTDGTADADLAELTDVFDTSDYENEVRNELIASIQEFRAFSTFEELLQLIHDYGE